MQKQIFLGLLIIPFFFVEITYAQPRRMITPPNSSGEFSLGARSTLSAFDSDGAGLGTGGQFRIRLSERVNTDWFADYITINAADGVRSTYYHVGWSVLFYPIKNNYSPKFQPYILAGHCFDYNRKTLLSQPDINKGRWGSAAQVGLGVHYNISQKLDLSLTSQYMIHLTKEIELEQHDGVYQFHEHSHNALQGHLLTTLSINYKIGRLWTKR